jgi:type VI protein secretion system component Hcp
MAVTARSHGPAYGHHLRTEWERAMTNTNTSKIIDRELTETELRDEELERVVGGSFSITRKIDKASPKLFEMA